MTLLLCGPAIPFFHPAILIPALAMVGISLALVVKGFIRIAKAEEKSPLLVTVTVLSVLLMIPYVVAEIPVVSTLPFGFFAGLFAFIGALVMFERGLDTAFFYHLATVIGCVLNAVAIMQIGAWIRGKLTRNRLP